MQILLNINNENIIDKLLWMLEHFKSDGVEIIKLNNITYSKSKTYQKLEELNAKMGGNELIQFKLKNLPQTYSYTTTQTDDEIIYEALKQKYGT